MRDDDGSMRREDGRTLQRRRELLRSWARRIAGGANASDCARCGLGRGSPQEKRTQSRCACGAAHPLRCVECGGKTRGKNGRRRCLACDARNC